MAIQSPDILTFKQNLDATITAIKQHRADSHAAIKIQSMLNVTAYVQASRFLEGSIKHIVYNCCIMKGYTTAQLSSLESDLKKFNNPEFTKIRDLFKTILNFDILDGRNNGNFSQTDITFLNQIVQNRHRNVHASQDSSSWYNQNQKDITNFQQEFPSLIKIIDYLSNLNFNKSGKPANLVSNKNPIQHTAFSNTQSIQQNRVTQKIEKFNLWKWFKKII
ncbi:hypothetical protein [Algibacter luteus]|uniref:RiboL-PSP-HEPN domain-containing protein n=1 Tax=Algibacter luteus TaxID=1178825 RepID=A0A1M5ZYR1_9FLAO|nr:hypothetical protein [Algibacter luteus]SHI29391.1 hypothetical protein SAMN05216261_0072 [Algibacter luteus]